MSVEAVIKNCQIVSPEGISPLGVAVDGEKIVAVAADAYLPDARQVIDAGGRYVIPGVLDNHTHFGSRRPLDVDFRSDTAAAAHGGVTTVGNIIGVGNCAYAGSFSDKFDEWREMQERNAYTDFVVHLSLKSEVQVQEIPLYARKYGTPLFKIALPYKSQDATRGKNGAGTGYVERLDDGLVYTVMKSIAGLGPPSRLMVHCENIDVIDRLTPVVRDEQQRQDLGAWTDARPAWVEALDIDRMAAIASVTGCPLYIVHVSSAEGVDAVARARTRGVDIVAETVPAYLTLTRDTPVGVLAKVNPPLRDRASIERLWEALRLGIVECMGTDHTSARREEKSTGIWRSLPGFSGVENLLPIMLSEGVNKGRISLSKLVEVLCANNARAFGLYPGKGVIRVGSDADLVIVDLEKKVTLSAATLHHHSDFCVWEGWEVKGYPVLTMLRGRIVVRDGELVSGAGIGRYLSRAA